LDLNERSDDAVNAIKVTLTGKETKYMEEAYLLKLVIGY